ncbi:peroxisomal coenzyme A diphosphatase NUDT7 [Neosynchiropus ocellatus]
MGIKEDAEEVLKLHDFSSNTDPVPALPKASVLIPLMVKDGVLHALMTLRSMQMRTSAGEVCFPGGKMERGDRDEVHTALREAEEEIGLPPDLVQVVSRLMPLTSKNGLLVTPVVGFIPETFTACPNPAEVSEVFTVPLDFFTSRKNHINPHGTRHSFNYVDPSTGGEYRIWGLTAMFAIMVAVLALRRTTEFDLGLDSADLPRVLRQRLMKTMSKL